MCNPKASRRHGSLLPPPLEKYGSSGDDDSEGKSFVHLSGAQTRRGNSYITTAVMNRQIEEFQVCDLLLAKMSVLRCPMHYAVICRLIIFFSFSFYHFWLRSSVVGLLHFQRQGSAATEIEMERLKSDHKTSVQMAHRWKQMFDNIHQFCVDELLGKNREDPNEADWPGT